ncbi:four helix bundle protein [Chryseobacterium formosus]|uniref:Four helix bundle protein n=1 Tax=Chryseobacterium formosus TaxID=1537363 RepID=A0ABT3XXB6_9FLAO|nr:four helix bundle protein [Chryseobacterium formosus]MCX8526252.1 four helix bundle protein [Chryseobacterium formosus]
MRDFKKYDVWQSSHKIVLDIYQITSTFPKEELFGLTSQIRRSSVSIPNNIAEGCGRNSDKEFAQFLNIALGSLSESEYLLFLAKDLKYIESEAFERINEGLNTVKRRLYQLRLKLIK